jgi:hypothetical protein
MEARNRLPAR